MKKFVLLITGLLILGLAGNAWGAVWHVKPDGSDASSGQVWDEAFQTIQKAIDSAKHTDEIWVGAGTYLLENYYIFVNKAVAIYGGFDGTETQREERDWRTNITTVDGNNRVVCFYVVADAAIDGFTITNGHSTYDGGGITNYRSSPTISNCTFDKNSSDFNGGGIQNYLYSSPTISNCTFSGNTTNYADGGAIWNSGSSSPTITNSIFHKNTANRYGGAIYNDDDSSPTLTNCTFFENSAGFNGGGIYNYSYSSPHITNSILWGDTAPEGGEIYSAVESYPRISYSDIQGGYSGIGNIDANPDFVDPENGDFHLAVHSPSPCIDVGDPFAPSLPVEDFEGDPRIVGARPDMGVDEFMTDEPVDDLGAYVLYGKEKVKLHRIADSRGWVGSNRKIKIQRGRCGTVVGDLRARGNIKVNGSIRIEGNVVTNGKIYGDGWLDVTGDITAYPDGELAQIPFPELAFTAGGADIRVRWRRSENLDPGPYGRVRVRRRATLHLFNGEYFMEKFEIGARATVVIHGPVTINVVERLDIDRYAEIEIESGKTGDLIINVLNDRRIRIGRHVKFRGRLVAPNSWVWFRYDSEIEGAVHARRIWAGRRVRFRPHADEVPRIYPRTDPI